MGVTRLIFFQIKLYTPTPTYFEVKLYIKKSGINNLKVLFLFHKILYNLLEKRITNGGHQTNFLSGEQKQPLPPHILSIIQYKTLWSVLFVICINLYYSQNSL